ncbi:hypothetical protein QO230_21770 [Vibrio vulnificus]|uniref:hypothetical protein n=6 Tax=Vibrio vulnificus TaxID=672 RepID=UPI001CDD530D|nr:hypothetical protein [Vibrio vulnificus]EJR3610095.1 hypothetical protein [Vibrio vulnificus]ELK2256310.1 hypothetical protein [Vibrio vulnificus]ELV8750962.1 hypothetical protein [Vibrio vulnificus]ELV8795356.1 hypothetical protein [Vibrio vulnificus]MCA4002055.1 hypothetical protein [Vibrio vulnificus]
MDPLIWAFIGTIIGAVTSIATTVITSSASSKQALNTRKLERQERALDFQRENILMLQTELQEYVRNCSRIYYHDKLNFETSGKWGANIPPELDEQNRILSGKVAILIHRVEHDQLREMLTSLKSQIAHCVMSRSQDDAKSSFHSYIEQYEIVSKKLGEVLRSTYQTNA